METSLQIQCDSMQIVNGILEKMKILQGRYDKSLEIIQKQNEEIFSLRTKVSQSDEKLVNLEEQMMEAGVQIRLEKEKFLNLEKQLVALEHKLFLTEQKYQNMSILERERDELLQENLNFSKICTELESALEVYQLKNRNSNESSLKETKSNFQNEKNIENFQKNINELNTKWQEIKEELLQSKEIFRKYTDDVKSFLAVFSNKYEEGTILNHLKETMDQKDRLQKSEGTLFSFEESFNEKNKNLMRITEKLSGKKKHICKPKPRKHRSLLLNKNVHRCIKKARQVVKKFKIQISHQTTLRNKWRNTMKEIILNFENHIACLNKTNKHWKAKYNELLHVLQQRVEINF